MYVCECEYVWMCVCACWRQSELSEVKFMDWCNVGELDPRKCTRIKRFGKRTILKTSREEKQQDVHKNKSVD